MKIINKKSSRTFAIFLVIAGIGALWLTFWWYKATHGSNDTFGDPNSLANNIYLLYYYLFNSLLLILSGILLSLNKFKLYSILSIILGTSVTLSLFVFNTSTNNFNPLANLFILTVFEGIFFGFIYGGAILVPLFLFTVYKSFIQGIKYFRKKINYSISD